MIYNIAGDDDELAFVSAGFARCFVNGETITLEDVGKLENKNGIIRFIPDPKLEKLMDIAKKYPDQIVPYNEETKRLWAIDTIGDGGLHLDGETETPFYLGMEDGELVILDDSGISDEYDEDKDYVEPDAICFDKEHAFFCKLTCTGNPWSVTDMEFENQEDYSRIAVAFGVEQDDVEEAVQYLLQEANDYLLDDIWTDVLFIQGIDCYVDIANKIIRLDVCWSAGMEW